MSAVTAPLDAEDLFPRWHTHMASRLALAGSSVKAGSSAKAGPELSSP